MVINYVSHAGVQGWWQYEEQSAGRAGEKGENHLQW
jgi:hypothetical protein